MLNNSLIQKKMASSLSARKHVRHRKEPYLTCKRCTRWLKVLLGFRAAVSEKLSSLKFPKSWTSLKLPKHQPFRREPIGMKTLASILTHAFRNWNPINLAVTFALGLAFCSTAALAQSGAGSIQGTVTDSTGAVMSGASIHVVQQGTNAAADTKSNDVGFYQVPNLFTGTYVVTITAPGMESYKATVELQVAQAAVVNPTMKAGAVTQQVQVAADVI